MSSSKHRSSKHCLGAALENLVEELSERVYINDDYDSASEADVEHIRHQMFQVLDMLINPRDSCRVAPRKPNPLRLGKPDCLQHRQAVQGLQEYTEQLSQGMARVLQAVRPPLSASTVPDPASPRDIFVRPASAGSSYQYRFDLEHLGSPRGLSDGAALYTVSAAPATGCKLRTADGLYHQHILQRPTSSESYDGRQHAYADAGIAQDASMQGAQLQVAVAAASQARSQINAAKDLWARTKASHVALEYEQGHTQEKLAILQQQLQRREDEVAYLRQALADHQCISINLDQAALRLPTSPRSRSPSRSPHGSPPGSPGRQHPLPRPPPCAAPPPAPSPSAPPSDSFFNQHNHTSPAPAQQPPSQHSPSACHTPARLQQHQSPSRPSAAHAHVSHLPASPSAATSIYTAALDCPRSSHPPFHTTHTTHDIVPLPGTPSACPAPHFPGALSSPLSSLGAIGSTHQYQQLATAHTCHPTTPPPSDDTQGPLGQVPSGDPAGSPRHHPQIRHQEAAAAPGFHLSCDLDAEYTTALLPPTAAPTPTPQQARPRSNLVQLPSPANTRQPPHVLPAAAKPHQPLPTDMPSPCNDSPELGRRPTTIAISAHRRTTPLDLSTPSHQLPAAPTTKTCILLPTTANPLLTRPKDAPPQPCPPMVPSSNHKAGPSQPPGLSPGSLQQPHVLSSQPSPGHHTLPGSQKPPPPSPPPAGLLLQLATTPCAVHAAALASGAQPSPPATLASSSGERVPCTLAQEGALGPIEAAAAGSWAHQRAAMQPAAAAASSSAAGESFRSAALQGSPCRHSSSQSTAAATAANSAILHQSAQQLPHSRNQLLASSHHTDAIAHPHNLHPQPVIAPPSAAASASGPANPALSVAPPAHHHQYHPHTSQAPSPPTHPAYLCSSTPHPPHSQGPYSDNHSPYAPASGLTAATRPYPPSSSQSAYSSYSEPNPGAPYSPSTPTSRGALPATGPPLSACTHALQPHSSYQNQPQDTPSSTSAEHTARSTGSSHDTRSALLHSVERWRQQHTSCVPQPSAAQQRTQPPAVLHLPHPERCSTPPPNAPHPPQQQQHWEYHSEDPAAAPSVPPSSRHHTGTSSSSSTSSPCNSPAAEHQPHSRARCNPAALAQHPPSNSLAGDTSNWASQSRDNRHSPYPSSSHCQPQPHALHTHAPSPQPTPLPGQAHSSHETSPCNPAINPQPSHHRQPQPAPGSLPPQAHPHPHLNPHQAPNSEPAPTPSSTSHPHHSPPSHNSPTTDHPTRTPSHAHPAHHNHHHQQPQHTRHHHTPRHASHSSSTHHSISQQSSAHHHHRQPSPDPTPPHPFPSRSHVPSNSHSTTSACSTQPRHSETFSTPSPSTPHALPHSKAGRSRRHSTSSLQPTPGPSDVPHTHPPHPPPSLAPSPGAVVPPAAGMAIRWHQDPNSSTSSTTSALGRNPHVPPEHAPHPAAPTAPITSTHPARIALPAHVSTTPAALTHGGPRHPDLPAASSHDTQPARSHTPPQPEHPSPGAPVASHHPAQSSHHTTGSTPACRLPALPEPPAHYQCSSAGSEHPSDNHGGWYDGPAATSTTSSELSSPLPTPPRQTFPHHLPHLPPSNAPGSSRQPPAPSSIASQAPYPPASADAHVGTARADLNSKAAPVVAGAQQQQLQQENEEEPVVQSTAGHQTQQQDEGLVEEAVKAMWQGGAVPQEDPVADAVEQAKLDRLRQLLGSENAALPEHEPHLALGPATPLAPSTTTPRSPAPTAASLGASPTVALPGSPPSIATPTGQMIMGLPSCSIIGLPIAGYQSPAHLVSSIEAELRQDAAQRTHLHQWLSTAEDKLTMRAAQFSGLKADLEQSLNTLAAMQQQAATLAASSSPTSGAYSTRSFSPCPSMH